MTGSGCSHFSVPKLVGTRVQQPGSSGSAASQSTDHANYWLAGSVLPKRKCQWDADGKAYDTGKHARSIRWVFRAVKAEGGEV